MARGRPRKFDEDQALGAAMQLFWEKGYSATSLDDLAGAMKMNRPSIYNAFGNKIEIYRKATAKFCDQLDALLQDSVERTGDVQKGFNSFFASAIDVYCDHSRALGCFVMCTAPSSAISNPEIGGDFSEIVSRIDSQFEQRLVSAKKSGNLGENVDPKSTAKLLQATLHTLALRARSGDSKDNLRELAAHAVEVLL